MLKGEKASSIYIAISDEIDVFVSMESNMRGIHIKKKKAVFRLFMIPKLAWQKLPNKSVMFLKFPRSKHVIPMHTNPNIGCCRLNS